MNRRNLIVRSDGLDLQNQSFHTVFNVSDVHKKMSKLSQKSHRGLYSTYEKMLERGSRRYQAKPSGVQEMNHLYGQLPNFKEPLDELKRMIALSQRSDDGLEIEPMLLLGPPGVGKTHFAKTVADFINTSVIRVPMGSMTAGWILSGSSSQWEGSKPGKVFEAVIDGDYINPVIVVDEIDKAAKNAQYDPVGSLYDLLEQDTAQDFTDEFAEIAIDASRITWIVTANDERTIPEPLLDRMDVFRIESPTFQEARDIAKSLYQSLRNSHGYSRHFDETPTDDLLDCLAEIGPRRARKALKKGFGEASKSGRSIVIPGDIPKSGPNKKTIGFIA